MILLCIVFSGRESEDLVATGTNPLQPVNTNSSGTTNGGGGGGGGNHSRRTVGAVSNGIQSSQSSGALSHMTSQSTTQGPSRKFSHSRVSSQNVLAPAGSIRSRDLSQCHLFRLSTLYFHHALGIQDSVCIPNYFYYFKL